jgi:hypothetical protein
MAETLIDSFNESNNEGNLYLDIVDYDGSGIAQSFVGEVKKITKAKFYLSKVGNPTGNIVAKLYAESHETAFGEDSIPTGSPLAISDNIDVAILTEGSQLVTFNFNGLNQYIMSAINYCIAIKYGNGSAEDAVTVGYSYFTHSTHAGNGSTYYDEGEGAFWEATSNFDIIFYVYGEELPPPDTTPPVIARLGEATVNLTVGDSYEDAGATALDETDGDITSSIVTVNPVNTAVANTYTVTYNVIDTALNPAVEVTRTVIVSEPVATVRRKNPFKIIYF